VQIPDFLRTSTFRTAASFTVVFALSAALLFAFIYWQTAARETRRIDQFLTRDAALIAQQSPAAIHQAVSLRITGDLHRITYAALFDGAGHRLAGNVSAVPGDLPLDGQAHEVGTLSAADDGRDPGVIRAVARRLPDGGVLVIGRNVDALLTLRGNVIRALELGVAPAMILAIVAGAFVSWRAQRRVRAVHNSVARIMQGDLRERLPADGTNDDFDRLAGSVNLMLDEIGRLLDSVKEAGNDIAHDLRTPLARLRTRLERSRETGRTAEELRDAVGAAIADLDQTLGVVTTVLRIGDIESGGRRAGFAGFDLGALAEEVAEIYRPLAEDKEIELTIRIEPGLSVRGDRGLLLEAIANLVQNAIKFTPAGGHVAVAAEASASGPLLRVADDGPGIPEAERARVFERFRRLDKSRGVEGSGLGLSLVNAIARLHEFGVTLDDAAPGCVFEIVCRPRPPAASPL
jgi:signal transduction histidine kinase